MKLWLKTVLIIGTSLVILIVLLSILLSSIVLERFTAYEQAAAQQNAARATTSFWKRVELVDSYANSWAIWDAMYDYIAHPDHGFIDREVVPELKPGAAGDSPNAGFVHLLLFLNPAGDVVWGTYYDRGRLRFTEPPPSLRAQLTSDHPLFQYADYNSGNSAILQLPDGEMLVATRPILTSRGTGPIRGSIMAGQYVDASFTAEVERTMRLPVRIYSLRAPDLPPQVQEAARGLRATSTPTTTLAIPLDAHTIASYALLSDVYGTPAMILQVEEPRAIYQQGQTGVFYLVSALIVVGLVTGVGMSGVLHMLVVRRLAHLDASVQHIRATNDLTGRVRVTGGDEVSSLARSINDMLTALAALVAEKTAALAAAEEANDLKTKFIANMSHELRTPLNAIINFTYILRSGMRGPLTTDQIAYLDRVYTNGEHLLGLINDILDLAKIEAGRMELYLEPLALADVVRSTLATAVGLTRDKPITLHHEIDADLPGVMADKTRLRQVLLNLLSNAAKFTDQGSITVRVWQEGDALITSIADTGIGIPADKLATIFEEFRQVDEGSARSYQGTGLGLPICKRLVELHGGRLWVESTLGVGSTFFFSLPLPAAPSPDLTLSPPAAGTEQGMAVLVIDDDPAAIEIVRTYLSQDGYAVYGLRDSQRALEAARQVRPVAIILDILMPLPSYDGWQVLSELKATPDLHDIPVICYTIVDNAPLGLALGASAYLVKPIQEVALRATVQRLVGPTAYILVIDDDADVREIVPQYLRGNGYEVATADGGQTGLQAIAARRPDLIILDLMMPEVDGFAVLEQLDQQPATRAIPVMVLTAKDLNAEERAYLRNRVSCLVSKQGSTPEQWLSGVPGTLRQRRQPPVA